MNKGCNQPGTETQRQDPPQMHLFSKADKADQEEQDSRYDSQNRPDCISAHLIWVAAAIVPNPEHHDQSGKRHNRNQACQLDSSAGYIGRCQNYANGYN